jgi:hypothetical protein
MMVDLIGSYSNRQDLADALVSAVQQLRKAQASTDEPAFSVRSAKSPRPWRVGDRLFDADIEQLIVAFAAGTSKKKLAAQYGVSRSSVRRLIERHGWGVEAVDGLTRHRLVRGQR